MAQGKQPALPKDELRAKGKSLRKQLPRRAHAELKNPERDVVAILEDQHRQRLQDLVPVRIGRTISPMTRIRVST